MDQCQYIVDNIDWSKIDIYCCGQYFESTKIEEHVKEIHESESNNDGATAVARKGEREAVDIGTKKKVEELKPYQCSMCGKTFTTRFNRNQHMQLIHGAQGMAMGRGVFKKSSGRRSSIPCRMVNCVKLFGSPTGLKIHMKTHKKNASGGSKKAPLARPKYLPIKKLGNDDEISNLQTDSSRETHQKKGDKSVHAEVEEVGFQCAPEQNEENYGLEDLKESDSSDDENDPKKEVPMWAEGDMFRRALIQQWIGSPNLDDIFQALDYEQNVLNDMFAYQKKRFRKRASTAQWDFDPPKTFKLEPE